MTESQEIGLEQQKIVQEWLKRADNDFWTIGREISAPEHPCYDVACFHAQQCIEKLLKALLIKNKQAFPRIHDLEELANKVILLYPDLDLPMDDLEWLLEIGLRARYPGIEVVKEQADRALEICSHLRDKLLAILVA